MPRAPADARFATLSYPLSGTAMRGRMSGLMSSDWQRLADVPDDAFEAALATTEPQGLRHYRCAHSASEAEASEVS
jgi:hypothetical protein